MVYDVWVDDVLRADDAPIGGDAPWTREATGVNRLGVYAISDGGTLRVDEIYVGPDHTMAFRCPKTTRRGPEFETPRPDAEPEAPPGGFPDRDFVAIFAGLRLALSKCSHHVLEIWNEPNELQFFFFTLDPVPRARSPSRFPRDIYRAG